MRGVVRFSNREDDRAYVDSEVSSAAPSSSSSSYRKSRMRSDWGIYDEPGHLTGGIYSVSDVAGVAVYPEDVAEEEDEVVVGSVAGGGGGGGGVAGGAGGVISTGATSSVVGDENVYGFNSRSSTSRGASSSGGQQWSSTHSLAPTSSLTRSSHSAAAGDHRPSIAESQRRVHSNTYSSSRDSTKHHDLARDHSSSRVPPEPLYRAVEKRGGSAERTSGSRLPPSRSYSSSRSGEYSTSNSGYRSLRGYPSSTAAEDYTERDREPRTYSHSAASNGYSRPIDHIPRAQGSLKRSGSKDYLSSSEVYSSRRSHHADTYGTTGSRGSTTVTKGILTNSSKYGGSGSRSSLANSHYDSGSRNNLDSYSGYSSDVKHHLSVPNNLDKRGSISEVPRSSLVTSNKGSQTELSLADDLLPAEGRVGNKVSLQLPEGTSSLSSRRSSSSNQQVTFSSEDAKDKKYDSISRRGKGTLESRKSKSTRDEQNQTDEEMSQWGGRNGGGSQGHWHGNEHHQYHNESTGYRDTSPQGHVHQAPPLPRPPIPPQHYPDHDGQSHGNHAHHNHSYHNHHPHHSHTHHSRQSSGSRQALVHAESTESRKCRDCMTRVPYATLIATLMCCVGVGVFCGTMYRGTTLTLRMFEDVFKLHIKWVEPVQLTFMVVGAGMGGLGLMILFVGCLSTGATRNKVYRTWRGRVGGRISCAIFMGITYLLSLAWLLMFAALIIITLFYTLAWLQCQNVPQNACIDYNQFDFLFPVGTLEEDKRVCPTEKKIFCKDYVNNAVIMFILASVSAFLVILSLVHYLMCLAANYAHIKDQEKFMDLQEIQFLQESEMSTLPKDRF